MHKENQPNKQGDNPPKNQRHPNLPPLAENLSKSEILTTEANLYTPNPFSPEIIVHNARLRADFDHKTGFTPFGNHLQTMEIDGITVNVPTYEVKSIDAVNDQLFWAPLFFPTQRDKGGTQDIILHAVDGLHDAEGLYRSFLQGHSPMIYGILEAGGLSFVAQRFPPQGLYTTVSAARSRGDDELVDSLMTALGKRIKQIADSGRGFINLCYKGKHRIATRQGEPEVLILGGDLNEPVQDPGRHLHNILQNPSVTLLLAELIKNRKEYEAFLQGLKVENKDLPRELRERMRQLPDRR